MKQTFMRHNPRFMYYALTSVIVLLFSGFSNVFAQSACNNESVLFLENFRTGTVSKTSADVMNVVYQPTGSLSNEGVYRVINSTQQKPEWQLSADHTSGDVDGDMIVINAGNPGNFYFHQINSSTGFTAGTYNASAYIMNVDTLGTCGADALLPNIVFSLEYLSADGNTWIPFSGSPMQAAPVAQTAGSSPTWAPIGFSFTLPLINFNVKSIRLVLSSMAGSGCGDDFAIDDIKVSQCASGGALPVSLLSFGAHQKGTGVFVEWATSQEFNSNSFNVERSADGSSNWTTIASVSAAGNSSTVRDYNAYDAKPFNGANFYRIKQVDKDGAAKYSKTVHVSLNTTTSASVLANPFHSILTVDLLSNINQSVSARILDITGKQVASEKWVISNGSTRKEMTSVSNLQQGMYILSITDANGQIIYNNKVVKQ